MAKKIVPLLAVFALFLGAIPILDEAFVAEGETVGYLVGLASTFDVFAFVFMILFVVYLVQKVVR